MTDNILPNNYRIEIASERALIVYFDDALTEQLSLKIKQFDDAIKNDNSHFITDTIPSYASVLIIFNPLKTDYLNVKTFIKHTLQTVHSSTTNEIKTRNVIELPVFYDVSVGPDLERIAFNASLSIEDVIHIHQSKEYQVFAIGFAPGFGYLGNVDERIATPRLATPRNLVPKGAVAIADQQTAIYPAASPGGWNIIGRCPINMFDADATSHMPFTVGDSVKFVSIDKNTFLSLGGEL